MISNKCNKYFLIIFLLIFINLIFFINANQQAYATSEKEYVFSIYDEYGEHINSCYDCQVGDMFIADDNLLYEVYDLDFEKFKAYAKPKVVVELPKVQKNSAYIKPVKTYAKNIGMYHTHNDESYVIGDGYDSIYGEGGIVDIGDAFVKELNKFNINVYKNDALHLPHDENAYVRSKKTAQKLLTDYNLDAIFDVHRDGVPRKQFLGEMDGVNLSKIRIVVGKSNPTYTANLELAKAIKAFADEKYPGLIKDIYIGSGRYNQNLSNTSVLFEMGTYLIEKDYVERSLPFLADTIDKVLYTNAVDSSDSTNDVFEVENKDSINLNEKKNALENVSSSKTGLWITLGLIVFVSVVVYLVKSKKLKLKKKKRD